MTIPPLSGGVLPAGRWHCEAAEVADAFVTGQSASRDKIWRDWTDLTNALRVATNAVAACWISGSFVSDKIDPSDLDCVYIIRLDLLNQALSNALKAPFLNRVAMSQMRSVGINLDTYILPWSPQPGTVPSLQEHVDYLKLRGYWDDLWGRIKDANPSIEMLPRRGYLEVGLDGYQ